MEFVIADDNGLGLDATVEVELDAIIVHSRGGAMDSPKVRNRDYSVGLRLVLRRLLENDIQIAGAWVDSSRVQMLPLEEREILSRSDFPAAAETLFTLMSRRMQAVGRSPLARSGRGNSNKRIRISIEGRSATEIARFIGAIPKTDRSGLVSRLPAEQLRRVTAEHIWQAIAESSVAGPGPEYGPSTDYDLLTDTGLRLAPKAVFGRALSLALNVPIVPGHFVAGIGTPSFDLLQKAGYRIVTKEEAVEQPELLSADDKIWTEGAPRLVNHLRRERGRGIAKAKKAAFIRQHGRLFCERCLMEPVQVFGDEDGEACIEIHHHATAVAEMGEGHSTRLEDLQCLCANCHRYTHRIMKRKGVGG